MNKNKKTKTTQTDSRAAEVDWMIHFKTHCIDNLFTSAEYEKMTGYNTDGPGTRVWN